MSECEKCKRQLTTQRDSEDNLFRNICNCEVTQDCHQCKRGKVNQAVLDRSGGVIYFACAKHGLEDAKELVPPGGAPKEDAPKEKSAGRIAAEMMVDAKLRSDKKGKKQDSGFVSKKEPGSIFGSIPNKIPLNCGVCEKCLFEMHSNLDKMFCPVCGKAMKVRTEDAEHMHWDGLYEATDRFGTNCIATIMGSKPGAEIKSLLLHLPQAMKTKPPPKIEGDAP